MDLKLSIRDDDDTHHDIDISLTIVLMVIVWLLLNGFTAFIGILDQSACVREGPIKRLEVVFPGYHIGRWLVKPLRNVPSECAR